MKNARAACFALARPEFDELKAYEDINKDMHDLLFVMLDKNKMRLKDEYDTRVANRLRKDLASLGDRKMKKNEKPF